MALLRAVVTIHPAGLGGSPLDGHRCTAAVKASWTASSAIVMSRKTRTRMATARPYSSRNTRSISESWSGGPSGIRAVIFPERADLDRKRRRPRQLRAPRERRVEIGGPDDGEAADVFLAFGERTVGGQDLPVPDPHDRRGARVVEPAGEHPGAGGFHFV